MGSTINTFLRIGFEEGVENFAPEISEPWKAASCNHGENYSKDDQQIIKSLGEAEEFTERYVLIFFFIFFFFSRILV